MKTEKDHVRKLGKAFKFPLIIHLSLLIAHEVFYSAELLDFARKTISPDSISLMWTPIAISMPFGKHEGSLYADGVAIMPNLTFFILLGIVCFNLYVIWRIEKSKTTPTTKSTV